MPRKPVDAQAVSILHLVLALRCSRPCCEKRGTDDGSFLAGYRLPGARRDRLHVALAGFGLPRPVSLRSVPTRFVASSPDPIRFIPFRFDSFLPGRPDRFRFDPTRPVLSRFNRSHTVLTECGRPVSSRLDSSRPVPFSPVSYRLGRFRCDLAGSSRPVPFGPSLPDPFRMPPPLRRLRVWRCGRPGAGFVPYAEGALKAAAMRPHGPSRSDIAGSPRRIRPDFVRTRAFPRVISARDASAFLAGGPPCSSEARPASHAIMECAFERIVPKGRTPRCFRRHAPFARPGARLPFRRGPASAKEGPCGVARI